MSKQLPKYTDFMLPTLKALVALGGSAAVDEINDYLVVMMKIDDDQLDARYQSSGALIIPDRMSWARSYLRAAKLVDSGGKGVWLLTDTGRDAANLTAERVKRIVADASKAANAAKNAKTKSNGLGDVVISDEDGQAPSAPDWSDILLAKLQSIEPAAFERLCQRLLREHGFTRVEVTGKSGDGGIDGQGVLRVNLVSFHVLFQCKRYKGSVGSGTIRDFRGAMQGRADKGLVITTGTFTPDARREATRDGAPAIDLIDGEALCDLLRDVNLGVVVRPVTTYEISIDDAFFDEV